MNRMDATVAQRLREQQFLIAQSRNKTGSIVDGLMQELSGLFRPEVDTDALRERLKARLDA